MKKRTVTLLVSLGAVGASVLVINQFSAPTNTQANKVASATVSSLTANFADLPMSFEPISTNDSQTAYFSRGRGHGIVVDETGIKLQLRGKSSTTSVAIVHENAQKTTVEGEKELPGKVNYFIGNNPEKWRTNVRTYEKVRSQDIYPGIDLVCYGSQDSLEFDYVVSPNADPNQIGFSVEGAEYVKLSDNGDLLIGIEGKEIRQQKPISYQLTAGNRRPVESEYVIRRDGSIGYSVGSYDELNELIIDPVLLYSTYFGGSDEDSCSDVATDSQGNAYITGTAESADFPAVDGWDTTYNEEGDAFVAKFDSQGSLVFSTFIGGSDLDRPNGIVVDDGGNIYVAGDTFSDNFPTFSAFQTTDPGGENGFVSKLSNDGAQLLYSTYLGGSSIDVAQDVSVDSTGAAYVTGQTISSDFPTLNAIKSSISGNDAFVTKLDTTGQYLVFSTFMGGGNTDRGFGIANDASGSCYVAIETRSDDLTTVNPIQATYGGAGNIGNGDAYIAKLNGNGSQIIYATYLGGSDDDSPRGIAVDMDGNCYVSGNTYSSNFPTSSAFQATLNGGSDAFLVKLSPNGSSFVYSTYLGGSNDDLAFDVACDLEGNAYATGRTESLNFPVANPTQPQRAPGEPHDAFVSQFDSSGSGLIFSTYLGGSITDQGFGIATDSINMYVVGASSSPNFPTANAYKPTLGGASRNGFVTKLGPPPIYTYSFPSFGDTYVKKGPPNANQGMETVLTVQTGGKNRSLVSFDHSAIATAVGTKTVLSARLRVYVLANLGLWDPLNPGVSVRRMITDWTELGATWKCPNDTNTGNSQPDGSQWEMDNASMWPFLAMATDTVMFNDTTSGWVEFDVTDDLQQFLNQSVSNFGWIIKKDNEGITGGVQFSAREGTNPPELVIVAQ